MKIFHETRLTIYKITALLLVGAWTTAAADAATRPVPLITDYNSIRVSQYESYENKNGILAEHLIDRDANTYYHSNYTYGNNNAEKAKDVLPVNAPVYIEAHLNEPTDESKTLYIYTQARSNMTNGHPTQFRIAGSHDGVTWTDNLAIVNIAFSGTAKSPGEENFSEGFKLPSGYQWLRFICTQTKNNELNPAGYPYLVLAEFQLYRSETDLSAMNGNPQAWMADESHTILDYNYNYKDFTLNHTHGVLYELNHNVNGLSEWCDWSKWQNGEWSDSKELEKGGISMPEFSYINQQTAPWGRVEIGDRQRTHVTERTVYAIPGQVTTLYPFSDLHTSDCYNENFVRWYDYPTDGNNRYLDFLHDPGTISRTDAMGYLGSTYLANAATEKYDIYIYTIDDYKELVERVSKGETRIRARQCADLNFSGRQDILPIGWLKDNPFRGVYDGGGFAITNLVIDRPDWGEVGLFGHVGAAVIRNIHVGSGCRFIGKKNVGLIGGLDAGEYESQETGSVNSGALLVNNVSTAAEVVASDQNAGGILGCNLVWNSQVQVMISNCMVYGSVKGGWESASVCGWIGNKGTVTNTVNVAPVSGAQSEALSFCRAADGKAVCIYGNAYDNNSGNGLSPLPYSMWDARLVNESILDSSEWSVSGWGSVLPTTTKGPSLRFGRHSRGAYATFYCPADEDFTTQYIAADFSQTFQPQRHIDYANKTITEPIIAFRHIFTVVNAKDLAEQVSGSVENNANYISQYRRTVRARAGVDFQIRFEHPQPVEQSTRTTMFYKDPQGVIRRVRKSKIKVTDRSGNDRSGIFYQTADYQRPSPRALPYGEQLDFYDAGKSYSRMMKCDAANASGRFTVHLVGCDENGNELKIYGSDKELVLAEYIINFVDEKGAAMTSEADMQTDRFAHTRPSALHDKYGDPIAKVDFDEYRLLDKLPNRSDYIYDSAEINNGGGVRSHRYKWPVPWDNSQYAFGYNDLHDYNMYVIADHSNATPYHGAADEGTTTENFGKGTGRFDRLFYDTEGADKGFFYYVNAASDPGVMASLNTSDLCPGSTLFVSAWVAEFSKNAGQIANLIFNFKVVKKDGTEFVIHSFVTGYVPWETVGRWQHVYYQFTPNLSQLNITSEDIHSYQLVLENNCMSSSGADYAIDDIRIYASSEIRSDDAEREAPFLSPSGGGRRAAGAA